MHEHCRLLSRGSRLRLALGFVALAAGACWGPASVAQGDSRSALETAPQGWTDITPKADLKGWTRLAIPSTARLGREQWHVDPSTGYLLCDGDGGHDWLRYDRELGDFIYHIEWRYEPVPGGSGYNSGVYARNSSDAHLWHQAQVGSSSGGYLFGATLVDGTQMRFNFSKDLKEQCVKPAGQWNTYEITCRGKSMRLWVNGTVTNEWTACLVPRGYVGVEGEGWKIAFRNIKLKEL
jgi:hypothetical protein